MDIKEEILVFGRECAYTGIVDHSSVDSLLKKIMKAMGAVGGRTTKKRHGKEHYQRLAAHMNKVKADKRNLSQ